MLLKFQRGVLFICFNFACLLSGYRIHYLVDSYLFVRLCKGTVISVNLKSLKSALRGDYAYKCQVGMYKYFTEIGKRLLLFLGTKFYIRESVVAQTVEGLDYELDDRGSIPAMGRNFSSSPPRQDRLWCPPSLLPNEYLGLFLPG
jgi:hypothetical protein